MNSFFKNIIDWLRGIKNSVATGFARTRNYPIGSIVSGSYKNWHTDPTPTILYLGTYQNVNNKKFYIHGIQLHYLNSFDRQWLLKLIYMMKRGGQQVTPRSFYYYIKATKPSIIKSCYRIYHAELANYYTISPGFSNISVKSCYTVRDGRDSDIIQLNKMIDASYNTNLGNYSNPAQIAVNQQELQEHITAVLNTRKYW